MIVPNYCKQKKVCEMPFVQAIRGYQFDQCKVHYVVNFSQEDCDATSHCFTPVSLARCRVVKTNHLRTENKGNRAATKHKRPS